MKQKARQASPKAVPAEPQPSPILERLRPWMVIILALLVLAPFLGKALTIDDPLFVWQAQYLQQNLLDPFGSQANWFGTPESMLVNVQNPPVTCYWLALAGLVSWKESWLHLAMLPFPLLAIWGVIQLARRLGADPFWAGLLTLCSVGFLVSATNLMCDIMLTCGIIWSIYLWIKGLDRSNIWILILAAFLAGLTALTKYFGISLIPLLAVYTLIRKREINWSLAPLLVPVAMLVGWHFWTMGLYDVSHILGAAKYTDNFKKIFSGGDRYFAAVTFLGGCIFWPLIVMLCRIRSSGRILFAACAFLGVVISTQLSDRYTYPLTTHVLAAVFFAAGIAALWLTAEYHIKNPHNPEAWLIALWIWGTIFFMAIVNWTVAARSMLPMIPALAILISMPGKQAEEKAKHKTHLSVQVQKLLPVKPFAAAAILGLALAVLATWADFDWANSIRRAANEMTAEYKAAGKKVFFQGHWGFQYYMQLAGATIQNMKQVVAAPDSVTILPWNSSNTYPQYFMDYFWQFQDKEHYLAAPRIPVNNSNIEPQDWRWQIEEHRKERTRSGFYLTDEGDAAGFYSHILGFLPLAFSPGTPDRYLTMTPQPPMAQPQ